MTLHPATLRAVTKIAEDVGEPLVKADCQSVIVGPVEVRFLVEPVGHVVTTWWDNGDGKRYDNAPNALRAALRTVSDLLRKEKGE